MKITTPGLLLRLLSIMLLAALTNCESGKKHSNDRFNLTQIYSTDNFSIRFPSSWYVAYENLDIAGREISVNICQPTYNDLDYPHNVNILLGEEPTDLSTRELGEFNMSVFKHNLGGKVCGIAECNVGGCAGTLIEYEFNIDNWLIHMLQYQVKRSDNRLVTVTFTMDKNHYESDLELAQAIVDSIELL